MSPFPPPDAGFADVEQASVGGVREVRGCRGRVQDLIREAEETLRRRDPRSSRLEAEVLLSHVLGRPRAWLWIHWQEELDRSVGDRFRRLVGKRAGGVPLQHLTGRQEFWSLDFLVNRHALIPRPESELLVEETLRRVLPGNGILVDIGTGCGNLAVALARELPGVRVYAVDISSRALAVARRNVETHGVRDRVRLLRGDGFQPLSGLGLEGKVDAVVSNPPYLSEKEALELPVEVRDHEPRTALVAGETGEEFYPRLVSGASRYLRRGGVLVMELGLGRAAGVRRMLESSPGFTGVQVLPDLAGIERVAVAVRSSPHER